MKRLSILIANFWFVTVVYVLLAVVASVQMWTISESHAEKNSQTYTKYNNYVIFRQSYRHLKAHSDLYKTYPKEHWDYFKYSPTFALFFGCFACLPDLAGLMLWNLLNVMIFILAIRFLPLPATGKKVLLLLMALFDVMTSLQNSQSNVLVAALLILGFCLLEKRKMIPASLMIVLTFFIKIYGIIGLILFIFYPDKKKFLSWAGIWFVLLTLLPLPFTGIEQLKLQYLSYLNLLLNDLAASYGISLIGILHSWFRLDVSKTMVLLAGLCILCLPLLQHSYYGLAGFRSSFFAALMIWMVIFNHKAESPTFIIATAGVFYWFFSEKLSIPNLVLTIFVLLLTSLSATDLFPSQIRDSLIEPYALKALPCILVFIKIIFDLWAGKKYKLLTEPQHSTI